MARLFRFSGLLLALLLPPPGAAAQEPGVRVDRSVLDALGPAPRQPLGPGLEAQPQREPRRVARRPAPRRPAEEATKDGVVRVPPPPPIAAAPPREEGVPRPLAPSLLPPTIRQTEPPAAATPPPAPAASVSPAPATPPPAPPPTVAPAPRAAPPPLAAAAPPPAPAPTLAAVAPSVPPPPPAAAPTPAAAAATRAAAQSLRLGFNAAETELNPEARQRLLGFAGSVPDDDQVRITVNAYASGDASDPSRARRTALSRALAVRTALMEGGIRSTRIDVRALGLAAGDGPPDRVDVIAGAAR